MVWPPSLVRSECLLLLNASACSMHNAQQLPCHFGISLDFPHSTGFSGTVPPPRSSCNGEALSASLVTNCLDHLT